VSFGQVGLWHGRRFDKGSSIHGNLASIKKDGRVNTIKILRIPLVMVLIVVAGRAFTANAQTETNLHIFVSSPSDGAFPVAALVQGSDSNFYGTTYEGGANVCSCGTVFQISPSGAYTALYSFGGYPTDGGNPQAGLVRGNDGNFYGTTQVGGTNGAGTVFRISPGGVYTNLYSFVGSPTDGADPNGLVQGSDGNFYGTTVSGGTNNAGTVFRISPGGAYTNLYSFAGSPNGSAPVAGLVQGSDGNLYGTTASGGTNGFGTVFRISPGGAYTNLYSFSGYPTDGGNPQAGLVQGSDGNFYGTTQVGGANNAGAVFRISPAGTCTNLYSFSGYPTDGGNPQAGLVQGSDGNFYGTTYEGGANGAGTVFRISLSGSYSNLYSFSGYPTDGENPDAGLVQGSDGNFYGTTYNGGTNNAGTVFKLTVPLTPPPYPINQITSARIATTNIIFTIPSIASETYQLQYRNSLTSGSWSNVAGVAVTNSIGSVLTLTNFAGASQPQGFYRFDITP
jgi:uncharacterized repeat protein (TIGR03803 family)